MLRRSTLLRSWTSSSTIILSTIYRASITTKAKATPKQKPASKKAAKKPAKAVDAPALGIVSEDLCDDILKQLGPSLEKHKGCDIIDFSPGEGLWSRKLHQLLQPRCHLLIEQDSHRYEQSWKTHVEEPGSKYKWCTIMRLEDVATYVKWDEMLTQRILPELPTIADSTKSDKINNSILVLANTSRVVKKSTSNRVALSASPSEPILFYILENLRYRSGFQSAGAVRVLLWTSQNDKYHVLPRNVVHRSRTDLNYQEAYFAQEIANDADFEAVSRRAPTQDVQSAYNTALRMKEHGITLPLERRSKLHQAMLASIEAATSQGDVPDIKRELDELRSLEVTYFRGDFARFAPHAPGEDKRFSKHTTQYARILQLRANLNDLTGYNGKYADGDSYVSVSTALYNLYEYERNLRQKYPEGETLELHTDEERANMKMLQDNVEKAWDSASGREFRRRKAVGILSDNDEAIRMDPPLLDWDRRQSEPLNCFDHEFDPPKALCLIDLQPLSNGYLLQHGRSTARSGFVTLLLLYWGDTITRALNVVAHGAADALIPQCPSLTDPAKGGHKHLNYVPIRLLTHEMFGELEAAWNRWPFRISEEVLQARIKGSSGR